MRERRPRPLQQLRHDRRVHRVARPRRPVQRLRLCHVREQTVRRQCHQSLTPVPDHGGLLGPPGRQVRRHAEGKGAQAPAADAGDGVERPDDGADAPAGAAGPVRADRALKRRGVAAAAAGDGRVDAAAAAAARQLR